MLLGAILKELGNLNCAYELKSTLNPLTKYKIDLDDSVVQQKEYWGFFMRLHVDRELFDDLIEATAASLKIPAIYVEKDYWVTYILKNSLLVIIVKLRSLKAEHRSLKLTTL